MEFIEVKTFSPANQIARNQHNDEELELLFDNKLYSLHYTRYSMWDDIIKYASM